jgi:hypothetical protein
MKTIPKLAVAGGATGVISFAGILPALARAIVADRVFPATLVVDDPGAADGISVPLFWER